MPDDVPNGSHPRLAGPREAAAAVRRSWIVIACAALALGVVALVYSAVQTPEYSASATLYVTSGSEDDGNAAFSGGQAAQQRVASYTKLAASDAVIDQALNQGNLPISRDQARRALSASSSGETVLLTITATLPNREMAARLANALSQAMSQFVVRLETPAGGGQPLAKLTIITPAVASQSPVSPRIYRNVALGIVIGLMLGIAFVLARARLDNRVKSESDVSAVVKKPTLGAIPSNSALKRMQSLDFSTGGGPAAEAFRKLRTNLSFVNVDNPMRVILVTSANPVEGKTTTAVNLGLALAESGEKCVVVDADLRKPQVARRLGLQSEVGLTNFLRGDAQLADLVQPTDNPNFWVLASGPLPPNPAELLNTGRARSAVDELSKAFVYVVVDCPPIIPVTDALVLTKLVTGVLLVSRYEKTRVQQLARAVEELETAGAPLVGCVLTDIGKGGSSYRQYGTYNYSEGAATSVDQGARQLK